MSEHTASETHEGHHRNYVKIWAILLVLLVISVLGPFLEIQVVTLVTAFGIAGVKAWMVAKNFMHLDVERPIVLYILGTCLAFMVLFYSGTAPDVMEHDGLNWENQAAKASVEAGLAEWEVLQGGGGDPHAEPADAGHH